MPFRKKALIQRRSLTTLLCAFLAGLLLVGCSAKMGASTLPENEASVSREASGEADSVPDEGGAASAPTSGEEAPRELSLTVPEGYTLARVGMELEAAGVCTVTEFIAAAESDAFSELALLATQPVDESRCFRLEGYLFPDTYQIYVDDPPEAVLSRMLARTAEQLDQALLAAIEASGHTVDEVLTIASIIEKEAFGHPQMPYISSVLHNRLDAGMKLQCDVTITYVEGAIKPFITGDTERYNSAYNTYKCAALPAGPICNPGLDAIRAAVSPADTDYLFFVTDADKNYYYAAEYEEHLVNVEKAGIGVDSSSASASSTAGDVEVSAAQ